MEIKKFIHFGIKDKKAHAYLQCVNERWIEKGPTGVKEENFLQFHLITCMHFILTTF